MANDLVVSSSRAIAEAGQLSALQEQVLRTIPGAEKAPMPVIIAACTLAMTYDLNIQAGEVYIAPFGRKKDEKTGEWVDSYSFGIGIRGARVLADRESRHQISYRRLEEEEVRFHRGNDYDPGDVGVEATLVRYDDAATAQRIGIPYEPVRSTGFYRVRARFNNTTKKWAADTIPNSWTAEDVAKKRAAKKAYAEGFSFGHRIPAERWSAVDAVAEGGVLTDSGDYVDVETAAAAGVAQRLLTEARREMQAPISDGEIDEEGYITETAAEKMRRTRQAIPAERVADAMADQAGTPKLTGLPDWSSGAWDVRIEDVHTGNWEGLGTDAETGLRTWLHRGAGTAPDAELWAKAVEAMDAKLGKFGTYVTVACLTGQTEGKLMPGAISQGLIDAANGKAAKAMAALETYAQQLQDDMFGDADKIPFGDEEDGNE